MSQDRSINVLLTCAGRRNYLVNYFREALAGRGLICAADASPHAAALQEADVALVVPSYSDPDYIDTILAKCREHDVRLVLSLNDYELPLLAAHAQRFRALGITPVISSPEVIDVCFDKWATSSFLSKIGLAGPATWTSLPKAKQALQNGELKLPHVVKPRWGSGSVGIYPVETVEELDAAWQLCRLKSGLPDSAGPAEAAQSVLIQERLRGVEYGLDVVNDLEGNYVTTFVRRKLAMRAGETDRAIMVNDSRFEAIGKRLGQSLRHIGNLDCDVFLDGEECRVLELNPRFGGGYPFSHMAGANLPAALIAWVLGQTPSPSWLTVQPNVVGAKCDRLVAVTAGAGK